MSIFHIRTSLNCRETATSIKEQVGWHSSLVLFASREQTCIYSIYFRSWKKVKEFRRRVAAYREITNQK
ncbi:hypothetical protein PGIN_3-3_01780 [Porphyromonas gingivalis]|nr:hypothetical protein PGIN_3-3_01780 [Porphyromonas gingivalis]